MTTRAGKAEEAISVSMYEDEWQELLKLLDATLDALDTKGSEYSTFKSMIGHIENQTSIHRPDSLKDGDG